MRQRYVIAVFCACALAILACQNNGQGGGGGGFGGPVEIDASDGVEAAWGKVYSLREGAEFRLTIPESSLEKQLGEAISQSENPEAVTDFDITLNDNETVRYDFKFVNEEGREFDGVVVFAVALTTAGDFVVTAEEAELSGALVSFDVPPAALASFNDGLSDELTGKQYFTAQGQAIRFTGIDVTSDAIILEGYLE